MNAPHPPPAGWYPDPAGRAPFRYWDGIRWTEHTQQGTAPAPAPTGMAAPPVWSPAGAPMSTPSPVPQPPGFGGAPAAAPYGVAASRPAGPVPPLTGQGFFEDLKRFEGYAVVIVGFLLFLVCSFLPWVSGSSDQTGTKVSDSSNAWDGDGAWLIRGYEVTSQGVTSTDSGTDMVILLPLGLIAAGVVVAKRLGKPISKVPEVALAASGLLAVLLIAEAVHISGAIDDLTVLALRNGITVEASLSVGFFGSIFAALVMTAGGFRMFQASRQQVR